jgi:phage-related minor tail protein
MVGERGPELIVPSRNAQVVPNNQLGGGGVVVNQTINVSTGVQQTVRAEIKQLMPQIADSAKAAVADAKRRGGSYGRAFA